jgi:hypothetical protein
MALAGLSMALWGASTASAVVMTTGCVNVNVSCTLQELFNGGMITVNDKKFLAWNLEVLQASGPLPNFNLIEVVGLDDGGLDPGPGIKFNGNGQLVVEDTDFLDLRFNFGVSASGPFIVDNSLEIVMATVVGTGLIDIREDVFDPPPLPRLVGSKHVELDPFFGVIEPFDRIDWLPPRQHLLIEKEIFLEGSDIGDLAELDMFVQRFSQIPEPGTLTLLGVGLAGVAWLTRRKRGGT